MTAVTSGQDALRARLERFYTMYAPEKLQNVDQVVATYAGREPELFAALTKKYGPEPPADAAVRPSPRGTPRVIDTRAIVVKYFTAFARDKLSTVDTVLQKYQGRETDLIDALQAKYGPVPEDGPTHQTAALPARSSTPPPAATSNTLDSSSAGPDAAKLAAIRCTVEEYFTRYAPEKLSSVDSLMIKYKGIEQSMVDALRTKYGPLPTTSKSTDVPSVPKREPVTFNPAPRPQAAPVASPAVSGSAPVDEGARYRASTSFEAAQQLMVSPRGKKSAKFSDPEPATSAAPAGTVQQTSPRAEPSATLASTALVGQTLAQPVTSYTSVPPPAVAVAPQAAATAPPPLSAQQSETEIAFAAPALVSTEASPLVPMTAPIASATEAVPPPPATSDPSPMSTSPAPAPSTSAALTQVTPPAPAPPKFAPPVMPKVPNVTEGIPEAELRQTAATRARLVRFYRHYAPEKVSQVDVALRAYRGREEIMFQLLETKYGPEAAVYAEQEDTEESRLRAMVNASLATSPHSKSLLVGADNAGRGKHDDKPFDAVVAAKLLGSHVDVGIFGVGNEKFAASVILMLNAIGNEALFDATQATIPMPTFQAREVTALDRFAFEKVLHFRFVWIDAWFRGLEIRNLELAARRSIAEQMAHEARAIQYQEYVLRQAIKLIGPIETERRALISEEQALRYAGALSWFRTRRDEILLTKLAHADSLILSPKLELTPTSRRHLQRGENAEIINVLKSAGSGVKERSNRSPAHRDRSPIAHTTVAAPLSWTDEAPTMRSPLRREPPHSVPPTYRAASPPGVANVGRLVQPLPLPLSAPTYGSAPRTATATQQRSSSPGKIVREGFLTQARRVAGARGLFSQHGATAQTLSSRATSVRSSSGY